MNGSFYSSSVKDLVDQSAESILRHLAENNPFALDALQRNARLQQICLAQSKLQGLAGWIAFEFAIPRMGTPRIAFATDHFLTLQRLRGSGQPMRGAAWLNQRSYARVASTMSAERSGASAVPAMVRVTNAVPFARDAKPDKSPRPNRRGLLAMFFDGSFYARVDRFASRA